MPSDFIHAQHAAQLGFIQSYMDNRNWATEFIERGEKVPLNILSVTAPRDANGRERVITFAYVPLDDEDLDYISLIQFYSPLPIQPNATYVGELDKLFAAINPGLAIGHFGRKENEIFMRHIYTTPQGEMVDEDMFIEATLLFFSLQTLNSQAIEAVATGKKTAEDAIELLDLSANTLTATKAADKSILNHVKAYFDAAGWPYEPVKELAITAVFEGEHDTYRGFVQAREENRQLIFYAVSPIKAPEKKLLDIMEFVTLANYDMSVGNFELDLTDGEIRYKSSIAFGNEAISANLLTPIFLPSVIALDTYMPAIRNVIEKNVPAQEAVDKIENFILDSSDE